VSIGVDPTGAHRAKAVPNSTAARRSHCIECSYAFPESLSAVGVRELTGSASSESPNGGAVPTRRNPRNVLIVPPCTTRKCLIGSGRWPSL
jgi:hypothetical protein